MSLRRVLSVLAVVPILQIVLMMLELVLPVIHLGGVAGARVPPVASPS